MRDGEMPAVLLVDVLHELAKQRTMCASVGKSVDSHIIMYHFMDEGVFELFFRQVVPGTEPQLKVVPLSLTETTAPFAVDTGSKEGLGRT